MEIPVKPTLQDWTQARIQEKRQQGLEEKRVHQNIQEKGNQKILRLIFMTREGGAPGISWKWQIIAKFVCISLKYWNIFEHPDGGDIPDSGNGTVVSRSSRSWFLLRCPAQTTVPSATLRKTVVFTTFYCRRCKSCLHVPGFYQNQGCEGFCPNNNIFRIPLEVYNIQCTCTMYIVVVAI